MVRRYLRSAHRRAGTAAYRSWLTVVPNPRAADRERAVAEIPNDPHVLFLCFGNICRSPLAECYMRRELDRRGISGPSVDSAGFFETEGRSSPAAAVEAAEEFGVDLEPHESSRVTGDDVRRSDLILVMDAFNYYQFRRNFSADAYYLGAFDDAANSDIEIEDPYDGNLETFRDTYREVATAVDTVVAELAAVSSDSAASHATDPTLE